ncbi:hypothetical protein [Dyella mobilis]|uniref:OAR domain-containing protein n=1 Tax=Dyella mobilis TaxID=1849582 RepID=A0ABS2KEQ4_9GAMM|nr:hypothetical protein [Dyella mobilis]MBM7129530.1 hypothetical protein [Dyella mobilis]GLQ98204.1 hypothetical protein GCM10007863_26240 [Dyella mobilis]
MHVLSKALAIFAATFILGCSAAAPPTALLTVGSAHVSAQLNHVSHHQDSLFIHGELTLSDASRKLKSANLNCFALTLDGTTSEGISADSIASILIDAYHADANGQIKAPVYWVFPAGKFADSPNLSTATLRLKPGQQACFNY